MAEHSHPRQARRSFLALAAGAMLALAGCIPAPRAPAPTPAPAPAPVVREETRPVVVPPGDEARNLVAVLVPLSGPNAGVGQSIANAAKLALLDTGGEKIRITVYDTAGGAAAAAETAAREGNGLFLGPLLADDVRAVAPVAARAGIPILSFSNDVGIAGGNVYIMGFDPAQSIGRVVAHARAGGAQRFAGLIPDGTYGRRASQALIAAVEGARGRMVAMQSFDRSPTALNAAIARLNAQSGYDAVLIADNGKIALSAAPGLRSGPSGQALILGTELWKAEAGLGEQSGLRGAMFAAVPDAMFDQLRTRYRARYGVNPYRLASLGYDAVLLAVRIAGDEWKLGRTFPASALRDPGGFMGVDGAFRFGADGIAERSLEVQEVTATGFRIVSPAPKGFGG